MEPTFKRPASEELVGEQQTFLHFSCLVAAKPFRHYVILTLLSFQTNWNWEWHGYKCSQFWEDEKEKQSAWHPDEASLASLY